jgi:chaperonin GroES
MSDNPTRITPTGHLILVKLDKVQERTAGGLYVPETARQIQQKAATTGTIVAVGPQAWLAFDNGVAWAHVGERICFPRYSGITIDADIAGEEDLCLMNDADCKGIISRD